MSGLFSTSVKVSLAGIVAVLLFSCSAGDGAYGPDHINEFHRAYFMSSTDPLVSDNLALYVDYSTCIAQAMQYDESGSKFYQALVPPFTHAAKSFYSIKGSVISQEQGDTYELLKSVKEVNYADLATAANKIANGNTEAVLLTDGEYYQQTIAKGNINNPYMADAIKTWLKRGHDVHIFAEPYVEVSHGKQYSKKRFYFLFTDNGIENNIFDIVRSNVDIESYPNVSYYHLTANHPTLYSENGASSTPNEMLGISPDGYGSYEIQDWTTWRWKDIKSYIMYAADETTGEVLPNGQAIIKGLKVDKNFQGGCFRIEDIDLVVSDINDAYNSFAEAVEMGEQLSAIVKDNPVKGKIALANNYLLLDNEEFKNHGEINLYFDAQNFNGDFQYHKWNNYVKVDVNVKKSSNNFNNNPLAESIFTFDSIDVPGEMNTSLVESIKLAVSDPSVANMVKGKNLYSIYIITPQYK